MRIMMMHRTEPKWEAGELPSPQLIAEMGQLLGEMGQAGVLHSAGGLRPSSLGVRLRFSDGKCAVTDGPFTESKEMIGGFAILRVKSLEEAIHWGTRFAGIVGDVEMDIRPVTEPWDLGITARPDGLETTRYMAVHRRDESCETGAPPTPQLMERMGQLLEEMRGAGVLLGADGLLPSSQGLRVRFAGGKRTVTDGPFTEAKELIAGFVILQVKDQAEALDWATRFAGVVGDVELDLRPMHG